MLFKETGLQGAYIIEPTKFTDERGEFFRSFCSNTFKENNLEWCFVQTNISKNLKKGTLRGMHFQNSPYCEVKLIRCLQGSIYDVIIDIREGSSTFGKWIGVELTEKNDLALYVPKGFAHGFVTLEEDTTIMYQVSENYMPGYESGIRYEDPYFNIDWKYPIHVVSSKDKNHELWDDNKRGVIL